MVASLFTPRREPSASYDFFDIASGTGYVSYDGINALTSTGNVYTLMDSSLKAIGGIHDINITGGNEGTNITVVDGNSGQSLDIDFNLSPFQIPRTIKGTALVKITGVADSGGTSINFSINAKLRKWDGSNEIEIANSTSEAITITGTSTVVIPITVPSTHFKKGDNLRLTLLVSTGDNDQYGICHDPSDSATTALTEVANAVAGQSRLILAIPYKVDL